MNILFISIAWPSPGKRNLYSDLMDEFIINGHNVFVVGTQITDNLTNTDLKVEKGIRVLRVKSGKILKASYLRKATSLLTLGRAMFKSIVKYYGDINIDFIIASTPPVTLSPLYKKLKKRYKASLYLLLKDIWPEGSVDLNVFRKNSLIWLYLRYHEIETYKTADYIGTMSPMNREYLLLKNKFLLSSKVEVCPNSIRPSTVQINSNVDKTRKKYGIPVDACVFILSGNLAKGHGLGFLIDAIIHLSDYSKAFFIIGGAGTHMKLVKNSFRNYSCNNVFIYEWLPQEDFELILRASDVGLILLDKKFSIPQFPSRLLSYLDFEKPVLCAVNKNTDIGSIVKNSNSGKTVIHGDLTSFVNEVKYFSENENARLNMGRNARKLLINNYTAFQSYEIIKQHFIN